MDYLFTVHKHIHINIAPKKGDMEFHDCRKVPFRCCLFRWFVIILILIISIISFSYFFIHSNLLYYSSAKFEQKKQKQQKRRSLLPSDGVWTRFSTVRLRLVWIELDMMIFRHRLQPSAIQKYLCVCLFP